MKTRKVRSSPVLSAKGACTLPTRNVLLSGATGNSQAVFAVLVAQDIQAKLFRRG